MSVRPRHFAVFLTALSVLCILVLDSSAASTPIQSIPCIITGTNTGINTCIASAIPLSFVGIGLALAIMGAIYLAGEVLNSGRLKNLYKAEAWETAKSIIIIAIILSTLAIASSISAYMAGATTASTGISSITTNLASLYTTVDNSYLTPQLQNMELSFAGMMGLSVGSDLLQTTILKIWLPIPIYVPPVEILGAVQFGATAQLLKSNYITSLYNPGGSLLGSAANLVITMLLIFQVQHDLLYSIAAVGLGVFIPVGIVMRAIPFIRGIGGTMIAIGIMLSIVYPVLLVGFNLPVTNYMATFTPPEMQSSLTCGGLPFLLCEVVKGMTYLTQTVSTSPVPSVNFVLPTAAGPATQTLPTLNFVGITTGNLPLIMAFGMDAASIPGVAPLASTGFWTGILSPLGLEYSGSQGISSIYGVLNFVIDETIAPLTQFLLFVIDIVMGVALAQGMARLMGGKITLGIGKFKLA